MKNLNCFCILIAFLAVTIGTLQGAEPIFVPVKIDGPVHDPANHSYWFGPFSECASVLDVDNDGDLDIAAGRNWYEAPDWKKHKDFRDGAETNGPETDDNSEFAMDVNRDGKMDIVSSGWMRMKGAFWYENPGRKGIKWRGRRIHSARSMEGVIHGDIDGDGDDDILCNHWSLVPGQGMTWIEHIDKEPWLVEHVIGTKGETHGNGLGDINGDGRTDIVTQVGWYEGPRHPTKDKWIFHEDYKFTVARGSGAASHPILVYDVDEDGLNDIIIGAAHAYGLVWMKQSVSSTGKRTFKQIWVETGFGQFHTIAMDDLNGDGKPDLVSGKRLFAHHGRDTSCYDPLFTFWYDIQGGKFERHVLSYNHLPWYSAEKNINPAPNYAIAVGMKLNIADMDKDGHNDIIVCGKGGLYIFYYRGKTPSPRVKIRLSPESTYPSWIPWHN
ncbi:MAG TPA: VCBS repeat-containing protein [Planctomycetes bacterium]|nr:VCBS repeat-containing protein [Planctomycetota bacterium]